MLVPNPPDLTMAPALLKTGSGETAKSISIASVPRMSKVPDARLFSVPRWLISPLDQTNVPAFSTVTDWSMVLGLVVVMLAPALRRKRPLPER